ncbi:MAG: hypothetical protein ACLFPJ_05830 [Candidatus Woesearchaeota archaeon]
MDIPKFKKKVNDFMLNEEGKISKQSIIAIGGLISAISISSIATKKVIAGEANDPNKLLKECQVSKKAKADASQHFNCGEHKNSVITKGDSTLKVQHDHHYNHVNFTTKHCSHSSGGGGGGYY